MKHTRLVWSFLYGFQSPRGDFGFLKILHVQLVHVIARIARVSIPSRGFWFFEASGEAPTVEEAFGFNPLAGILVF